MLSVVSALVPAGTTVLRTSLLTPRTLLTKQSATSNPQADLSQPLSLACTTRKACHYLCASELSADWRGPRLHIPEEPVLVQAARQS